MKILSYLPLSKSYTESHLAVKKLSLRGLPNLAQDVLSVSPSTRFGSKLDKNHGLKYPIEVKLGFEQAGQAQRALLLKSIEMAGKQDESHLVFSVDIMPELRFPAPLKGLTDALPVCGVTVDTLVKGHTTVDGVRILQSATGKRYMNQYATIQMGPSLALSRGPVTDARALLRIFNEAQRDLEWLVMARSGKLNRQEVYHDLQGAEEFNALRSLAYGSNGLVDAVIVGDNQLLTRPILDKFYKANGLAGKKNETQRNDFNKQYQSIAQVVAWASQQCLLETFQTFAPKSLTEKPTPLEKSVLEKDDKSKATDNTNSSTSKPSDAQQKNIADLLKQLQMLIGGGAENDKSTEKTEPEKLETKFYFDKEKDGKTDLERCLTVLKDGKSDQVEIINVPATMKQNIFVRDSIYFPAGFDFDTLHPLELAMDKLYEKKEKQIGQGKSVSNVVIVENSPGGAAIVTDQIKSKMESAPVPTDVVVQGWGCSGGSKLISMATGNRFITPGSSILLHETRGGDSSTLDIINKDFRSMEYRSDGYKRLIAKRTGRPYGEVTKDFKLDFEVNAVESILYGTKGLVDAILVGPDKILTRESVMAFIVEKKGSLEAAETYINQKFVQRREEDYLADIQTHQEIDEDPLANPLQLIQELVKRGQAVSLDSIPKFQPSISDVAGERERSMHVYKISEKVKTP